MDLLPSIARLDSLCDLYVDVTSYATAHRWPEQTIHAARCLAHTLEKIAGEIDTADDPQAARIALAAARAALPRAFEAFGRAIGENIATGSSLKRARRRRDPETGKLIEGEGTSKD
ncbi:MAG TPA: hypothetical protein VFC38_05630 [Stellaceae bacterium]|nr:hypothetical protein [Stellaceae bacterium]